MERTPVHQRSVKDLPARDTWSALEKDLWKECKLGRAAVLVGKSDLPEDCDDDDRKVRAEFIRYLMWGGSDEDGGFRPHPKGVHIEGGWIEGKLDLEACTSSLDLSLHNCRFEHPVTLRDARIGALYLTGSHLLGEVDLHRLTTARDVHLRGGFRADGPVDLGGARIGGALSCVDGKFLAKSGPALNCNAAEIGADVFLRGGFEAEGRVDFVRAQIAGNLRIEPLDGTAPWIEVGIDLEGARIGGGIVLEIRQRGAGRGGPDRGASRVIAR
ncbi:hypothetical protein [Gymnodinialimonas ulvae]|uniref:hypothetical protein n=1 Tax=Gymnodinialimonas ulvae TaxID=3126504 RepID=UPI003098AB1F